MKNKIKILLTGCAIGLMLLAVSCTKDLLDRPLTDTLSSELFWRTEDDAGYALNGLYNRARRCFERDYYFEGHGEYHRTRGTSAGISGSWNPEGYGGGFSAMYEALYGVVNHANYVVDNVMIMVDAETNDIRKARLEAIVGEARLLRALCYFRLISMWGDVILIKNIVNDNAEVQDAFRSPISEVKDFILEDLDYAAVKLPRTASPNGRAAQPAAIALRGKVNLFWASWKNFGWPELTGFTQSASEAMTYYTAAANDFRAVIDNYDLTLFRNGEPGECDELGKADKLPNYYYMFCPREGNNNPEFILRFTHGGTGTGQGEELMRDFAGRNHEGSQVWCTPRFELADRYQSIITGDFCPPLVFTTRANPDYFTFENSALNPQSYANRDYRMKATMQWDYERSMGMTSLRETNWFPFIYEAWDTRITAANVGDFPGFTEDDIGLATYNTDGTNSGFVYRKFVRYYAGQGRSDGDMDWPVIRLADVFLMYAEAINEVNNGPDEKAIELLNKIRYRGNLPPLAPEKTANKEVFFNAIDQERIIELIGEGHRGFDLRRWRAFERVWCPRQDPNGVWRRDVFGVNKQRYFLNRTDRQIQQLYIFQIPESERNRNPNLTQNECWL